MKHCILAAVGTLFALPALSNHHEGPVTAALMIDELEYRWQDGEDPMAWSAALSVGTDRQQVWLVSEGDRTRGELGGNELRAYYSHQIKSDWNVNVGWRGDVKPEPGRDWFLLGLEGAAPGQVGAAITAYSGDGGDSALRLEIERGFDLTSNWVLTPEVKIDFYGQDSPELGLGSGLSTVEFAARLAYEWSPAFAPYLGAIWVKPVGQTEDYLRAEGDGGSVTQILVGVSVAF